MKERAHIQTFGCQMNAYDTERMHELLADRGYVSCEVAEDADVVILNSCSIREKSEQKLVSAAGRFREWKTRGRVLAIGGCVAQQEGERLLHRSPLVDFTFGPDQIGVLPDLIERAERDRVRFAATDFVDVERY